MHILVTFFLASLVVVAVTHVLAIEFFLYWKYLWLDIPVHFLGGVTVAFGVAVLPFLRVYFLESRASLRTTLIVVFAVGIAWEIFEIVAGLSLNEPGFVSDTLLDLVMDLLGGVVGYGIVQSIKKL